MTCVKIFRFSIKHFLNKMCSYSKIRFFRITIFIFLSALSLNQLVLQSAIFLRKEDDENETFELEHCNCYR